MAHAKKRINDFSNGDTTALPDVYGCFAGHDKDLIYAAASALADKLEELSPSQLICFLNRMGEYTSLDWYASWNNLSLSSHRNWLDSRAYFAVLAMGSAHPNGYFREMCLTELFVYGGVALPFLLLRTNDWVQPIRVRSLAWAEDILRECQPEDILSALPYLYRLKHCRRRNDADYARLMDLATERLTAAPELLMPQKVQYLDRDGRRLCYGIAQQQGIYTTEQWVELLAREKDPFTRRIAARAMLDSTEWYARIELLLSHRNSALRLLALETVWERMGTVWGGYERFLCDQRQSAREWARFAVRRQKPSFDFAAYYRRKLDEPDCAGAVSGLGETGVRNDGMLVKPYLKSDSARVRKSALTALGRLCRETELETYYDCLLYGGGCAKIAFQFLQNSGMHAGCERLFIDLQKTEDPLIKRRLCTLLGLGSAWDSLPWLLRLWDDPNEEVALLIRRFLNGWQFGYQRPLPGELARCRATLDSCRHLLPAKLVGRLEFELAHA